jgi:hypothetical protein
MLIEKETACVAAASTSRISTVTSSAMPSACDVDVPGLNRKLSCPWDFCLSVSLHEIDSDFSSGSDYYPGSVSWSSLYLAACLASNVWTLRGGGVEVEYVARRCSCARRTSRHWKCDVSWAPDT